MPFFHSKNQYTPMRNLTLLFIICLWIFFSGCSQTLYPDRSQFIKDGETSPTIDLSYYKSVQERPGQDSNLAVAMAISGGGSRAANFGIGIMLGLESLRLSNEQDVLDQIDYLSTVSGGGFAGGAYVAALYEYHETEGAKAFKLRDYIEEGIDEDLNYSYTGVLLRANFSPRLWFSFVDDGDALERAIDDYVLGYKKRKRTHGNLNRSILLGDLFIPANSRLRVRFPMLITNSSTLKTMAIFPFTPDILNAYHVKGYAHRLRRVKKDSLDPFRVPLAVGVKASGSFPVLISNSTLQSSFHNERKYLHLIDGAMTDNIGYYSALEVLRQDGSPQKVLLVVDADASGNRYTFSTKKGAISSLNVLARLPSSGLDARRATLVKDIKVVCEKEGITPVFFGFYQLLENNKAEVPKVIDLKKEMAKMIQLLSEEKSLSDANEQILYELLTYIGTKYSMKKDEQILLFLAGQYLVRLQEDVIRSAVNRASGQ